MDEKQSQPPAKLFKSEEEQDKTIKLLEERLEKHDENRKDVQGKLTEIMNKLTEQIGELEDRINRELCEKFVFEEDRLQTTLNKLRGENAVGALQKAKRELSIIQSYEIIENEEPNNDLTTLYGLKIERRDVPVNVSVGLAISEMNSSTHDPSTAIKKSETAYDPSKFVEERERFMELLKKHIVTHDNNRKVAQDKLHEICEGLRAQIGEVEDRISKRLEEKFISEDDRLQATLRKLRGDRTATALQKAKAELLVEQSYEIIENNKAKLDFETLYELKAERRIVPELMKMGKPTNVRVAGVIRGCISVQFTCLNPDEEKILSCKDIVNPTKYKCLFFKEDNEQESKEYPLDKNEGNNSFLFTPEFFEPETAYGIRVKMTFGDRECEWSDEIAEFTTPEFSECVWKKCPDYVDDDRKYSVDKKEHRIATKIKNGYDPCTILGNTSIPLNTVTSWSIRILESINNNGNKIYIGVAPFDINQNTVNYNKCGWYFDCYRSTLFSGPPHNYYCNEYGPRKEDGQYVHTGDSVGVVMDTTKGELSFVLNGVNLGAAYEGIPLDKPLVPCVLLKHEGDSVELDTSEVKENKVDSSVPVPSSITVKDITWDTITLTWDEVDDTSFYQVEVDRNISCDAATTNTFTKRGLFPETEHSFRVRTVRGSSVSEWSGVVEGRTLKAPEFSECVWKKCPDYVDNSRKYRVSGGNPRIATIISKYGYECTIIGNTLIPPNAVTSWSIKVLKAKKNNGDFIYIGVAPNDIDQNDYNYNKCGWYFDCYNSALLSGPPHNYRGKEYGPRKGYGQYVHTGDSVGVVVDTTKGELSFVLNEVNLGVAYEGIPLDKPLVPCVLLCREGDSVELTI